MSATVVLGVLSYAPVTYPLSNYSAKRVYQVISPSGTHRYFNPRRLDAWVGYRMKLSEFDERSSFLLPLPPVAAKKSFKCFLKQDYETRVVVTLALKKLGLAAGRHPRSRGLPAIIRLQETLGIRTLPDIVAFGVHEEPYFVGTYATKASLKWVVDVLDGHNPFDWTEVDTFPPSFIAFQQHANTIAATVQLNGVIEASTFDDTKLPEDRRHGVAGYLAKRVSKKVRAELAQPLLQQVRVEPCLDLQPVSPALILRLADHPSPEATALVEMLCGTLCHPTHSLKHTIMMDLFSRVEVRDGKDDLVVHSPRFNKYDHPVVVKALQHMARKRTAGDFRGWMTKGKLLRRIVVRYRQVLAKMLPHVFQAYGIRVVV